MSDQPGRETQGTPRDPGTPASGTPREPGPASSATPVDPGASSSGSSTTDAVKGEAERVGSTAAESGRHVANVAKDEAAHVADEARHQLRDLAGQARQEFVDQAHQQKDRTVNNLRALSDELHSMAESSDQSGTAARLVDEASRRTGDAARWLEHREPGDLIDEIKTFARQRPGTFLLLAAGAGVLAGRLTRGTAEERKAHQDAGGAGAGQTDPLSDTGRPTADKMPLGATRHPDQPMPDRPPPPTPGAPADPLLGGPTDPSTDQPVSPTPGPRDIRGPQTSAPSGRPQAVDRDG